MPYGHLIAATVMTLGVCQGHSSIASFSMLTNTSRSPSATAQLLVELVNYLSKVANFNLPHLRLAPLQGMIPFEFRRDLQRQKTRVPELSCGVICIILRLAVFIQYQSVTNRQTQDDGIYRASIASHGKNIYFVASFPYFNRTGSIGYTSVSVMRQK